MLQIRFRRDSRQRLSSVFAEGHVDLAEHGQDVVCAAVSAILQAAMFGLTEYAEIPTSAERNAGYLSLAWDDEVRDRPDVKAIVGTAFLSVKRIAEQYPRHVRLVEEPEP